MIIMTLDHVRDFLHADAMRFAPEDLTQTNALLFFTRWITHFCAPVFMFAAGAGAYLWLEARPGKPKSTLSHYLLTRGLWLILLDLTAVRLAMTFSLTAGPVILLVFWALGASMIALAALIHLPPRWLAVLSIAVICLHNLADSVRSDHPLWRILHAQGIIPAGPVLLLVAYPLIPWIFVMAAGYCFAHYRGRIPIFRLGLAMTLAFVALRLVNIYGDPQPWNASLGLLSFLRVTKYPPSLDFLLMTLGPALMLYDRFTRMTFSARNPMIVFGRVPLFYFLAHMLLAHLISVPLAWINYGHAGFLWGLTPNMGGNPADYPPNYGYSLATVYLATLGIIVVLYPVSVIFGKWKQERKWPFLAYL